MLYADLRITRAFLFHVLWCLCMLLFQNFQSFCICVCILFGWIHLYWKKHLWAADSKCSLCQWSRPSDFSGGMLFPSDFLCLMKDQKRFIQFGFSSFSLLGVTISSMYFQYALRICSWDSCLSSLYFMMSLVLFDFFFLLYALSFFLISLRISVVIHGQPF